jgi:isopentenyl diphosphate isomerase/L-lactate dehydrogenase-like FMN-dependent dehydrogenase
MTRSQDATSRGRRFDSLAEAEALAARRLPRAMFRRLNSGAENGVTLAANRAAFQAVTFRPRGAAVHANRSTETTVLGSTVAAPILLGPVGALRLQHPEGAQAAIDAAARFGTICGISPGAGHSIAQLQPAADSALWYQVTTALGGREAAERDIEEATARGYRALVVTIDSGLRPKVAPLKLNARTAVEFAPDLVRHPRWTVGFVRDGMRVSVANTAVGASATGAGRPVEWDDIGWISASWKGPVVIKGVLTREDAQRAVEVGAAAVVVSNHGGLTLDGAPGTLTVLAEVLRAVDGRVEVLLDGGIRSGADAVKAIALGAKAVLVGRAYVMGLAVGGAAGVNRILEIFQDDMQRALAFLGCESVTELGPSHVAAPAEWMS